MSLRHFGIGIREPLCVACVSLCRFHATLLVHLGRSGLPREAAAQGKKDRAWTVAFGRLPAAQDSQLGRTLDKIKAYSREFVTLQVPHW